MPVGPVNNNQTRYQPADLPKQRSGPTIGQAAVLVAFFPILGFGMLAGCTFAVPSRPQPHDGGADDAPTDTNNNGDTLPDAIQVDVIQSDVIEGDVIQSDTLQTDAIQSDVIQTDAIQTDAQLDGPHCGQFSETDNWTGTQTDLDSTTISGSLLLAPFKTAGTYLKIWDLGSASNNIGSGADLIASTVTPVNTSLTIETCTSADGLSCTSWVALSGNQINSPANQFLHLRFNFATTNTSYTPQLNDYTVNYCTY